MLNVQLLGYENSTGFITAPVSIHFQRIYTRKQEFYG